MNIINTLNKLKNIGVTLINYLVPLLFLLGLTIIDVAVFIGFGLTIGLIVAGIMLVVIAIILELEHSDIPNQ